MNIVLRSPKDAKAILSQPNNQKDIEQILLSVD
jgi:hypothetical protein